MRFVIDLHPPQSDRQLWSEMCDPLQDQHPGVVTTPAPL
jgi:hypothetical protein